MTRELGLLYKFNISVLKLKKISLMCNVPLIAFVLSDSHSIVEAVMSTDVFQSSRSCFGTPTAQPFVFV